MKKYKHKLTSLNEAAQNQVSEPRVTYNVQNKCLYCYQPLVGAKASFHESCNKKFFGQLETPLLDYKMEDLENLATQIVQSQMTVTGVQSKVSLSLHRKEAKNTVKKLTIVGLYGDYILKPPSNYYEQLPEVESATMHMAAVCGLPTVPHSLVRLADNTLCYITKRVDRTRKEKLHMEDMCQLTERLTEDKYKGSHEQVAKTILKYSASPLLDVTNFYELVLFCYFTGNADMHLKNFSLLEKQSLGYTLCPAYDLVATALVNKADNEELALTLNGKKRKLNYSDFLAAFETNGLSKKVLDTTLENFYYCKQPMLQKIEESFISEELKLEFRLLLNQRMNAIVGQK
jgi:serine/threonine-protein kinase HipA